MPVVRRPKRQPREAAVVAHSSPSAIAPDSAAAGLSGRLSRLLGQIGGMREQAVTKVRELEHLLTVAKQELATIDGLMGRKITAAPASKDVAASRSKPGSRMPRGYWRGKILAALGEKPNGLNKSELLAALHARGDSKQEASVSNTLMSLKKTAEITHENGRYAKVA